MSKITRKLGCTYSYGVNVMKELIDKGYARSEFVGRRREVSLTPKGEMVADAVADYRAKLLAAKALYT